MLGGEIPETATLAAKATGILSVTITDLQKTPAVMGKTPRTSQGWGVAQWYLMCRRPLVQFITMSPQISNIKMEKEEKCFFMSYMGCDYMLSDLRLN